jgi:3-carboxy-cis,cis-muconate cycloisomerase
VTSLFWPGDHQATDAMSGPAFLRAMVDTEDAWLRVLADLGAAPSCDAVTGVVTDADLTAIADQAEVSGNPVIPLIVLMRQRLEADGHHDAARWLHRGLTSQDVVDTAMMLCARDTVGRIRVQLRAQVTDLAELVRRHRTTSMVARTLTQPAVPTTFGAKAATWLHGVLDAAEALSVLEFPAQLGGAAGTLSGLVELLGQDRARQCRHRFPQSLGLAGAPPWHTRRSALTRIGDAAVSATDAWGRIAKDVLVLNRPEIGELAEGAGGGSSTMPNKSNPTMSVLIRRTALAAPALAATLHLAAAEQVDERADGAWHAEWDTLATLLRRTLVAAVQATTLLAGLAVHTDAMAQRLSQMSTDVHAEQLALAAVAGHEPEPTFTGLIDDLVDESLARADDLLKETS